MSQLKLFGTRLLVNEYKEEKKKDLEKTEGGLFIPRTEGNPQDRLFRGKVEGVGDEVTKVKPGDEIVYDRMGPAPFVIEGTEYMMIDESAVIGAWTK